MTEVKQEKLAGFKPKKISEIEDKSTELKKIRSKRMELQVEERKLANQLVDLMKKHKVPLYRLEYDGDEYDVTRKPGKDKVSITRCKTDEGNGSDEPSEE